MVWQRASSFVTDSPMATAAQQSLLQQADLFVVQSRSPEAQMS